MQEYPNSKWERLNRFGHLLSLLNQESHSDKCLEEGIGDGAACCCGYSDVEYGLKKLIDDASGQPLRCKVCNSSIVSTDENCGECSTPIERIFKYEHL